MRITVQQLLRAVPNTHKERAQEFVKTFNEWNERFGINTPARVTHFLAQVYCESGELKAVEENMNYSATRLMQVWPTRFRSRAVAELYAGRPEKLANYVYAGRMGNGNEASGDGWKFIGRGLIGVTGRSNYQAYAKSGFCVGDLMSHPEWLAKSPGHTKSAMWFWWKHGLSQIADTDTGQRVVDGEAVVTKITKKVNGGVIGLATRKYYYRKFRKEFGL